MKLTYFTDSFLPWVNGVSTSLVTITTALALKGNKVQIFAPRPKNMRDVKWKVNGIDLVMLRSIPSFLYPDFRAATPISPRLIMYLRKFNPDIIHFQTTFLVGAGGLILGKTIRKPIIGTFHTNFMSEEFLKNRFNSPPEILSTILWKYALLFFNQCDAIVAPSAEASRDLKKQGVKRPVYVIHNTITENMIKKANETKLDAIRKKYKLEKNVLLYVGRVSVEKSLDVLLKSFAEVLKQKLDVTLLIIGDRPHFKELQDLTIELGIAKNVVFVGKVQPDKLLTDGYFQVADAFVTASSSEVQPVSLIEALYFGLPIIGVSKRGVGEMLKGVGLLSPAEDVKKIAANILMLLKSRALRDRLMKNSKKAYEQKYSNDKVIKQYERLYEDVLEAHKKKKLNNGFNLEKLIFKD